MPRTDYRFNSTATVGPSPTEEAVRRTVESGTDYLVADTVAIVEDTYQYPSMHGGGVDTQYLPGEALRDSLAAWNGKPLVLDHPTDAAGNPTVIRNEDTVDPDRIGEFRNPDIRETGDGAQLVGEAWLNLDRQGDFGGDFSEIVTALESGETIETSTGYLSTPDPDQGVYNGQHYESVQRNLEPDHLALFRVDGKRGNCSRADGCGVGRLNQNHSHAMSAEMMTAATATITNAMSDARTPEYAGTTSAGGWERPDFDAYVEAAYDHLGREQPADGYPTETDALPDEVATWIAQRSLLGDPDAASYSELAVFPVVGPDNQLSGDALDAVLSTVGLADISESAAESVRRKARSLLEDEFGREFEDTENAAHDPSMNDASMNTSITDDEAAILNRLLSKVGIGNLGDDSESSVGPECDCGGNATANGSPDHAESCECESHTTQRGAEATANADADADANADADAEADADADVDPDPEAETEPETEDAAESAADDPDDQHTDSEAGESGSEDEEVAASDSDTADETDSSTTTMPDEETDSDRVAEIADHEAVPFSADALAAMSDSELEAVEDAYIEADADDEAEAETEAAEAPDDGAEIDADAEPEAEADADAGAEEAAVANELRDTIADLQSELEEIKEAQERPKRELQNRAAEEVVANFDGVDADAVTVGDVETAQEIVAQAAEQRGFDAGATRAEAQAQGQAQPTANGSMAGVPQPITRTNDDEDPLEDVPAASFDDYKQE